MGHRKARSIKRHRVILATAILSALLPAAALLSSFSLEPIKAAGHLGTAEITFGSQSEFASTNPVPRKASPLNPVWHPTYYTVRPGDTMTGIAKHVYGNESEWTALWWANRNTVRNPNAILVGQRLITSKLPAISRRIRRAALKAAGASLQSQGSQAPQPQPSQQPPPPPSNGVNWYAVAQCESGGNWSIDTGNGFYGGLQFTLGTWDAYGGAAFASYPNETAAGNQITVADRVAFTGWQGNGPQGMGAWPVCGSQGYGASTTQATMVVPFDFHKLARGAIYAHRKRHKVRRALRAYWWAIKQAGCPYVWGGNGPCRSGFDCSGLVQEAFDAVGIHLPRTADEIMHSSLVRRVWGRPRKGDISFLTYGGYAYHVMFWVHRHWVFAAADPQDGVGWFRQDYMPPVYRVS